MRDSVANGKEKHSVLPARSNRIHRRQMYRKVSKDQTKQQQRVKKTIGCHGEKERMEERNGLDKLTLCKMLPWFTFVNV